MIAERQKVTDKTEMISDVLKSLGANWTAIESPLTAGGGVGPMGVLPDIPITSHKALIRSDNQSVISVVGNGYQPVQNVEAFAFLDAMVQGHQATYESVYTVGGGSKNVVQARMINGEFDIRKGDQIDSYITMINSFDGSSRFIVFCTPIRMFCQNQLVTASRHAMARFSAMHTKSVHGKMKEAFSMFDDAQKFFRSFQERAQALAQKQVDEAMVETFLEEVMNGIDTPQKEKKRDTIVDLAENGNGNNGQTLWDWYNGYTQFVDHLAIKDDEKRAANILVGAGHDNKANAWEVANALLDA